jgi:hypothetical protein
VFEHLVEPQLVLEKCWRMLRPGGILVMNFPAGDSTSFCISVKHSALRQSPDHLFLHNRLSTQLLLKRAGYENLKMRRYPVPMQIGATLNNFLCERKIPFSLKLFRLLSPIYRALALVVGAGDFITVSATKPCIH